MTKLNEDTWSVAFRCSPCGRPWGTTMTKAEAHEARARHTKEA